MRRLAAAFLLAAALGSCGGGTPSARAPAWDGTLGGAPLQRANCSSWHGADPVQRDQTVQALSATIGGASSTGGAGTTMPDAAVAALFDRVCGTPGTSSFALYLIYARAAAFSRQTPITAPAAQPPV